jgi:hypothetical protein
MALAKNLMGAGMAAGLATQVGDSGINAVTGVGTTQSSGPSLQPKSVNLLTTASSQTACTLPSPAQGSAIDDQVIVYTLNSTAGTVFPDTGSQIDYGTATTGSVAIAQNRGRIFKRVSPTAWISFYGS